MERKGGQTMRPSDSLPVGAGAAAAIAAGWLLRRCAPDPGAEVKVRVTVRAAGRAVQGFGLCSGGPRSGW